MGLAGTITIIFSIIMLGYVMARLRLLSESTGDGLSEFVFVVSSPLLLFSTMLTSDFSSGSPWGLWLAYFSGVVIVWTLSHCVIRALFDRDRRTGVVAGVTGSFSNLVFLGMPLVLSVYGQEGLVIISLIISIHMPLMMGASLLLYEWALRKDGVVTGDVVWSETIRKFVISLLKNPLVIGILSGWLVRVSGVTVPDIPMQAISLVAGVSGPLALFAMGMGLQKFGLSGNVIAATVNALLKLMVMPAIVFALAWALGLPPLMAKVAVAAAALPNGVNTYVIATRFGVGQSLSSGSMVITTAGSILSLALWISLTQAVWG